MPVPRIRLSPDGPEVSRLVWGAWQALGGDSLPTPKALAGMIEACLASGVTTFDHAAIYGGYRTEAFFGEALKEWRGQRETIEIVTKCGISAPTGTWPHASVKHYNTSAAHIAESLDRSLSMLGVGYVDLLLIHRADPFMDADDTARGLEAALASGKARHVGVSNFSPAQFALLQSRLRTPLVTNQIQFSLLHTAPLFDGTLDQAQELRRTPMVWSPLGKGRLFDPKDQAAAGLRAVLKTAGAALGTDDIAALALAWLLAHPSRPVPILGTNRTERLPALARAADLGMDRQTWFALLEAARGEPVP